MTKELAQRWEDLIRSIEAGRCVPFVGAGISLSSWDPDDEGFKPTVQHLIQVMYDAIRDDRERRRTLRVRRLSHELDRVPPKHRGRFFSRVAELAMWTLGEPALMDLLPLPSLARMITLPAHRYLARLQREGWLDEVMTTNWDTCLERAYRGTFRFQRAQESVPVVVRSGEEYQRAYRQGSADGHARSGEPVTRLFKLNGCAEQVRQRPTEQVHQRPSREAMNRPTLLLTDTQLAAMREDWKRELFRDRLRSRRLITSGFGADEPQVRYTVLEIVHSMTGPDGPFVQEFHEHPTFPQHQLLGAGHPDRRDVFPGAIDDRFFGGADGPTLGSGEVTELPADLFWRRVYQAAMWRRVSRALANPNGPLRRTLDHDHGVRGSGGPIVEGLRDWLGRPSHATGTVTVSDLCGQQAFLWDEISEPQTIKREEFSVGAARLQFDHSLLIMALVRAAQGLQPEYPNHTHVQLTHDRSYHQAEYYRPFHQDELAIGYALLACYIAWRVHGPDTTHLATWLTRGLLPCPARRLEDIEHAPMVVLRAFDAAGTNRIEVDVTPPGGGDAPRIVGVWALPSRALPSRVTVLARHRTGDSETVRKYQFTPLPVGELDPSSAARRHRPSARDRSPRARLQERRHA
ncbi:MAG TPA: SIR2 family protein [Myxococcota bacterium]|nr:SIR2 family protein [Myxococcota bacterium]